MRPPLTCEWMYVIQRISLVALISSVPLRAGLAPENVAVCVLPDSWTSLTLANHYAELRGIPGDNIVRVEGRGQSVDAFRSTWLNPALEELKQRGLQRQIRCIAWSDGFPLKIGLAGDLKAVENKPKVITSEGSINGLTYLYQLVAQTNLHYVSLRSNPLYLGPEAGFVPSEPGESETSYRKRVKGKGVDMETACAHQAAWGFVDEPALPSLVLGATGGEGFPVSRWIEFLRRARAADGTRPEGTLYLMQGGDIRSRTREWAYHPLKYAMEKRGIRTRIEKGALPPEKKDVAGAVLGRATLDWPGSGSTILPGAIVENLTSFGGSIRRPGSGQTSLIHFLAAGAAGSAGTVTEPYAIQAKFPSPFIHMHYVDGLRLAEAFYRSIHAPYQLLVIGDPLCAPWAKEVKVAVNGLSPGEQLDGPRAVSFSPAGSGEVAYAEWFMDGRYLGTSGAGTAFPLDLSGPEGARQLVLQTVLSNRTTALAPVVIPFQYKDPGPARVEMPESLHYGEALAIRVSGVELRRLEVRHFGQVLGTSTRNAVRISTRQVGMGPVRLDLRGSLADGREVRWKRRVAVLAPRPLRPLAQKPPRLKPGIRLVPGPRKEQVLKTVSGEVIKELGGLKANERAVFEGYLEIPETGLYRIQVSGAGVALFINGQALLSEPASREQDLPLSLYMGLYPFRLTVQRAQPRAALAVRFGKDQMRPLDASFLRYTP